MAAVECVHTFLQLHELPGIFPFNWPFANFCSNENTKTRYPYDESPSPADQVSSRRTQPHPQPNKKLSNCLSRFGHCWSSTDSTGSKGADWIHTNTYLARPPTWFTSMPDRVSASDSRPSPPPHQPTSYQAVYREEIAVRHLRFDLLVRV